MGLSWVSRDAADGAQAAGTGAQGVEAAAAGVRPADDTSLTGGRAREEHAAAPDAGARVLRDRKEALLKAWTQRVLEDPEVPEANRVTRPVLLDHIPAFLDQLANALEATPGGMTGGALVGNSSAAHIHAGQRHEAGYSLESALREWSHFRMALLEVAVDAGLPPVDEIHLTTRMTPPCSRAATSHSART